MNWWSLTPTSLIALVAAPALVVLAGPSVGESTVAVAEAPGGAAAAVPGPGPGPGPGAGVLGSIPPDMLRLYVAASADCPGLPWQVLAAVGSVESGNGTSTMPGVHSGRNFAGAEGPMQFEPGTFAAYAQPVPPGGAYPPNPYDPVDSVYAAARMLCAAGGGDPARLGGAVYDYNHSAAYVAEVLDGAADLGWGPAPGGAAGTALRYALSQVGTPYVWGGEIPGAGFDCSGLTQAAFAAAGVPIPRVAQDQFDAVPRLPGGPAGADLEPGDLVFFGEGPAEVSHVGIYAGSSGGQSYMVDAPHTGADVRVEPFVPVAGAPWGGDEYVGAGRPG